MSCTRATLAALLLSAVLPAAASAAPVTREYTFNGTNIVPVVGSGVAPVSTVNLRFRVTFDPLVQENNAPTGAVLVSSNLPLGSAFQHSFFPTNMDRIAVGGAANGALGINVMNNDFALDFRNALGAAPVLNVFTFATAATAGSAFRAFDGQITSTEVPAPHALASLLVAGLGVVTLRRRAPAGGGETARMRAR